MMRACDALAADSDSLKCQLATQLNSNNISNISLFEGALNLWQAQAQQVSARLADSLYNNLRVSQIFGLNKFHLAERICWVIPRLIPPAQFTLYVT